MPELPEVEITRLGVESRFVEKCLTNIEIRQPMLRWPIPEAVKQVEGLRLESAQRRSKYLLLNFSAGTVMIHLGMSGALRIVPATSAWQKHEHIQWSFGDLAMRLHDPRRFGSVDFLVAGTEHARHPRLSHLGVEPFSEAFTAEHLFKCSRGRKVSVKAFLLQGHAVVGVGNIYASESLFRAGIRPGRSASRLSRADCAKLAEVIKAVLREAVEAGGSSLRDFSGIDGELGHFQNQTFVYDRQGLDCRVCKTSVRRIVQNQRSSFYCPECQKK
ncbi:MAG: bifunctional DNA-formamidopyrimidine glycosylase/DNA-(apurinic or apyrimidinic site) lyase [Burkholderiales bacterium]|jgi:formamidopyrimidine-DNA glycosylase|nr:bifunctional DNA-formamidopyrimidine glycosylase/DNA-(apurinic or apyrimidinic site) lyase [Burkholderiales bacterium]